MTMPRLASSRWWYIMPIVFVTYSLAYLDRANYGFAAASGMADDLRITPGLSSLLGALFFLGYFFFQVPGAIYAEKRSVKKLIFVSLILWGGLATLTGMVANVYLLIGIRFLLGVVEAAVMPAMLVYLCHWFTRAALAGEHLPDPRQPGDHPLDVGGLRLPGGAFQLALDVHHRRPAGGDLGLHLVAPGG